MTSNGDWFEAMTESFPGRTPRVLLSSVYWSIVAFATLLAAFNTWAAFQVSSGSGMIALSISFVAMLVWLAVWRVMLEAAASLFDIRDSMGQLQRGLDAINQTLKLIESVTPGGSATSSVSRSVPGGRPHGSPAVQQKRTSMLASRVLRYLKTSDGATFEAISEALGVSQKAAVDALTQLQADDLVIRVRRGIYRSNDGDAEAISDVAVPTEAEESTRAASEELKVGKPGAADVPDAKSQPDRPVDTDPVAETVRRVEEIPVASMPEPTSGEQARQCGACGAVHDVGQRFCSRCGGEL